MSNSLVTFFGDKKQYFFVKSPEGFSEKCFTCADCNTNCEAGKIINARIVCFKCLYPGQNWCSQ